MHPDSKVHKSDMGPTWVLSAPGGPHVGPVNLAIRVVNKFVWVTIEHITPVVIRGVPNEYLHSSYITCIVLLF